MMSKTATPKSKRYLAASDIRISRMSLVRVGSRGTFAAGLYPSADHPAARPIASEHAALPFALRLLRIVFDRDVVDFADYVDHGDAPGLIGLVDEDPDEVEQQFEDFRHVISPGG